jgi:phage gp36-like protein
LSFLQRVDPTLSICVDESSRPPHQQCGGFLFTHRTKEDVMAYATRADIVALYGERALLVASDRDRDGISDEDVYTNGLESATAEIDSYLGQRYRALPLSSPSRMLKTVCIDIAIYRMSQSETSLTEEIYNRYKAAIDWLKLVAKGDVSAEAASASNPASGGIPTGPVQPGTGAVIVPTIQGGLVTALTLLSGGSGYIPTNGEVPLVFSGGDGNGAQGSALITEGVVTGVKLARPGSGYKTLPLIVVGLSGATLDPSLYPPTITGGKKAGIFFSHNRQLHPSWAGRPKGRSIPSN